MTRTAPNSSSRLTIDDIQIAALHVGKPAKVDHSLYGKVRYDGLSRVCLQLTDVNVISHRTMDADLLKYGILDVAVPKHVRRAFADIDDRMISLVVDNVPLWFAKGVVEESTIDDFYKRSIITTSCGPALRLKIQRDACVLAKGTYDLVLRCRGLRFFKHVFVLEWELLSAHPSKLDMFVDVNDEDDVLDHGNSTTKHASNYGKNDDICPTWEEHRALTLLEMIQSQRERIATEGRQLDVLERELNTMWPTAEPQKMLDSISNRLALLNTDCKARLN